MPRSWRGVLVALSVAGSAVAGESPRDEPNAGSVPGAPATGQTVPGKEGSDLSERARKAAEEPMETDRPDFTESPHDVAPGWLQVESGYQATYDREDGVCALIHGGPQTLWPLGLGPEIELRLGWFGWGFSIVDGTVSNDLHESENGSTDLYAGFKYALWPASASTRLQSIPSAERGSPSAKAFCAARTNAEPGRSQPSGRPARSGKAWRGPGRLADPPPRVDAWDDGGHTGAHR